ncbi:ribokinase [Intestinimonas sp.]|uniref:ribokinase n=1 Tax=Intestinimonas sp. TaxID=1965293 RepID=UPI003AB11778
MLKRPHILVVGSFMMDLIATTERAPGPGETVAGTGFRTASGGKGANQAVQCARLGAHVTMAGRVGDDAFGREALQSVRTAGVDLSRVTADPSAPTGVAHILVEATPQGVQNRITIVPGANFTLTPADLAWMEDGVRAFDMVLLQFELPMDVVEAAAGWANAAGVPVMVNPAPAAPISDRLLACADYLSPNEHEAAQLSGLPLRAGPAGVEAADLERVAAWFRARGVKELLVTLGENGAALAGTQGMLRVPCVPMERVADPTAAGDSFVGAFCTGLCAGLEREAALAFASHTAALTVSRMGAQPSLPTLGEVQTLLRERGCRSVDPAALDPLAE